MITAEVIKDSVSPSGVRLTSLALKYPRYIHAEFMTHRVFSRNASSSRAVPVAKLIDQVASNPVIPVEWGSNKPGMQAGEALSGLAETEARDRWILACRSAAEHARALKDMNVHKQIVNRLLEPFAYISVIVTATEWSNFFKLRLSELAQPEIRVLAEAMFHAMLSSKPIHAGPGYIHLPYVRDTELGNFESMDLMRISSARCARVSYLNHDGLVPDTAKDLALSERLLKDKHASVFEHQAIPGDDQAFHRNFRGWVQFRDLLGL